MFEDNLYLSSLGLILCIGIRRLGKPIDIQEVGLFCLHWKNGRSPSWDGNIAGFS